jgi:hypothetical protein
MGWTTINLHRNRMTLDQARADHLERMTKTYELLAYEWQDHTLFTILKPKWHHPDVSSAPYLRIDILEQSSSHFAYKDMCEEMGPYLSLIHISEPTRPCH